MSIFKKYGYLWVTGTLFLTSLWGQWMTHEGTFREFLNAVLENFQSEFMQLLWQVGGLMLLYAWGSSQSKDETEKQDARLERIDREVAEIKTLIQQQNNPPGSPDQFRPVGAATCSPRKPPRKPSSL